MASFLDDSCTGSLGAYLGLPPSSWGLGHLRAILGLSWAILGPSWSHAGLSCGRLEPSWGHSRVPGFLRFISGLGVSGGFFFG